MNLETVCKQVVEIARKTGQLIGEERKRFSQSSVEKKGARDLVSYVDVTAEKMIVAALKEVLPEAGFLTEEKTIVDSDVTYTWIIDPLDGTTNFVHGIPVYAVSIGLKKFDELIIGVVYEVNLEECFYAWKKGGAWLNGHPISVSDTGEMQNALCATGFPYNNFPQTERFFKTLAYLFQNTRGVRRFGSAAVDLAYVACGRLDAFYEYNLNPWDVAGGALVVEEAGGTVSDFSGGKNFLFGKEMIATNKNLHREFLSKVVNP